MLGTKKIRDFIVFGQPEITEEEIEEVSQVLRSGWIGTGKIAKKLEAEFERYMGGGHAVAVSSCSIGLVIALRSVGVCHGDNVLTTPLTFCATVNAIMHCGASPIFIDVDENGLMKREKLDQNYFQGNVWKYAQAVLPVNYTGLSANIKSDLPVIEDAAHSFGGECGYGTISVFSLYATKNITSAEGGIIWTKSKMLADKCRLLSMNGQSSGAWGRYSSGPIQNYQVLQPGYKGNLPDVLAAIGLVQLKRWPEMKKKRDAIWRIYERAFGKKPSGHSRHLYTIQVKNRQEIREALYDKGIGTGVHYEALHMQKAYSHLKYGEGDFPMAEKIGRETLSLPLSNKMTTDDAHYVVREVSKLL